MTAMASGQHAKYFEDAARAFSPQGVDEGNGILGHLFGSKDLSRAVASQAAQATGLSQQVLQQMLPAIASMVMGGLFKQTHQPDAGRRRFRRRQQSARRDHRADDAAGGCRRRHRNPPNPMDNPFGKVLQDMFGGGAQQPQSQPQQTQSPYGDNPLGKIFEEMLRQVADSGMPGGQPAPQQAQAPQPQTNPSGRPRNPFDDLFGKMFETGAQQRDDYQKGMESIFDHVQAGNGSAVETGLLLAHPKENARSWRTGQCAGGPAGDPAGSGEPAKPWSR